MSMEQTKRKLRALSERCRKMFKGGTNVDSLVKVAEKYEMHNGLLYRRCTDAVRDEVRLCCCAPLGSLRAVQTPTGSKCMDFRNELILEYHNSVHGGHRGRDATIEVYEKSFTRSGRGDSGSFDEFLGALSGYVGQTIVNEVEGPPEGDVSWHYNEASRRRPAYQQGRDGEAILRHVTRQTGIQFTEETRVTRVLHLAVKP